MQGRASLWRRTRRRAGRRGLALGPDAQTFIARLAAAHGRDVSAVLAEAQGVLDRAAAASVTGPRELATWIGREAERDPADVLAEAARIMAGWRW